MWFKIVSYNKKPSKIRMCFISQFFLYYHLCTSCCVSLLKRILHPLFHTIVEFQILELSGYNAQRNGNNHTEEIWWWKNVASCFRSPSGLAIKHKTLSRIANRRAEYRCIVFYLSCISFFEVYWLEAVKDVWKRKGSLFNPIFTAKMYRRRALDFL